MHVPAKIYIIASFVSRLGLIPSALLDRRSVEGRYRTPTHVKHGGLTWREGGIEPPPGGAPGGHAWGCKEEPQGGRRTGQQRIDDQRKEKHLLQALSDSPGMNNRRAWWGSAYGCPVQCYLPLWSACLCFPSTPSYVVPPASIQYPTSFCK